MAIINAITPRRTVTTLKVENGVKLKEIEAISDKSPYIYYEVCEGKRSHFETDYNKAVDYFYTKVLFF